MKYALLTLSLVAALAVAPSFAAEKPTKEHAEHAKKGHAHKDHAAKGHPDKDKCAEMMEHNKAPSGDSADASKNGCGMAMGQKKGMKKH